MKEVECIISGKVTGVMYRDFVTRRARSLWLVGFVQNISDYKVKVVAQGSEGKLNTFIECLRKGPFLARVTDVSVVWGEPGKHHEDFIICY